MPGAFVGIVASSRAVAAAFSPTDIAGLKLWLKADSLSLVDGDPVGTWADQSGNGNTATASGAQRPTYKTAIVNGKPIARFAGAATFMAITGPVPAGTVFVVVSHADGATFSDYRRIIDGNDVSGWSIFGMSGASYYNAGIGGVERNITASNFRVNGSVSVDASPLSSFRVISGILTTPATQPVWIGTYQGTGSQLLLGDVAEILIYDSALGSTDRVNVETYLLAKYGL